MPRYFFNSEDGETHEDEDGIVLENEEAARIEAVRLAGDLLSDRPQLLWNVGRWRVVVSGETGPELFSIEVVAATGASIKPWSD